MLGPVLGAALMGLVPIAGIMLVDILGAAFAIVCLLFVKIPDIPQQAEKPHIFTDMKQGFNAIRQNKPFMAIFVPMVLMNVLYMPLGSLFPLLIRTHFMGGAWHNGAAEFVFAGGLLVSSLIMGIWGGMKRRFLMASLAVGLLGFASLVSGILPPTSVGFLGFIVCCFCMGASGTFINVPTMAYVQETTASDMMGKVFSLMMAVMTLTMPIGLLLAGPLSDMIGVDMWFFYSGIGLVLTAILCRILTKPYDKETMLPDAKRDGDE